MNITFLIGNGFDRSLGLNTSYTDFYKWYVSQPIDEIPEHVLNFRREIDKYVQKAPNAKAYWSDAEVGIGQYTEKFSLETIDLFFDCYEDFRDNLVAYLKEQEELIDVDKIKLAQKLFAAQLEGVLEQVDASEHEFVIQQRKSSIESSHTFTFISFNYTGVVDKVIDTLKTIDTGTIGKWVNGNGNSSILKLGNVLHAHGYIDRWPILGVCEEYSIAKKELLSNDEFKSVVLKSESIKGTGELWRSNVEKRIGSSKYICIFGMSLGETDSDYWNMVSDWLTQDGTRHLLVFWRKDSLKKVQMSVLEKVREIKAVKNVFYKHSSLTTEEFDKIKDRIHVIINKNTLFALPDDITVKKDTASMEAEAPITLTHEKIDQIVSDKISPAIQQIEELKDSFEQIPKIHFGKTVPKELKTGDIWFEID